MQVLCTSILKRKPVLPQFDDVYFNVSVTYAEITHTYNDIYIPYRKRNRLMWNTYMYIFINVP